MHKLQLWLEATVGVQKVAGKFERLQYILFISLRNFFLQRFGLRWNQRNTRILFTCHLLNANSSLQSQTLLAKSIESLILTVHHFSWLSNKFQQKSIAMENCLVDPQMKLRLLKIELWPSNGDWGVLGKACRRLNLRGVVFCALSTVLLQLCSVLWRHWCLSQHVTPKTSFTC